MRFETVTMTPEWASQILEKNDANRNASPVRVDAYARDMANGEWELSPHGVVLNQDGSLLDGQHRLMAVVKSGKHVPMVLAKEVPHDVQKRLDRQRPRSVADTLRMKGFQSAPLLASSMRYMIILNTGRPLTVQTTAAEVESAIEAYPRAVEWFQGADKPRGKSASYHMGPMLWAYQAFPDEVEIFHHEVATGEHLSRGDPAHTLRESFSRYPTAGSSNGLAMAMRSLNALSAFIRGKPMKKLYSGAHGYRDIATSGGICVPKTSHIWKLGMKSYADRRG